MCKKMIKNTLTYSFLYFILIIIIKNILNSLNIEFISWFYYCSYLFIVSTAIIGIIQLVIKVKDIMYKICLIIMLTVIIIPVVYYSNLFAKMKFEPEYIVLIENNRLVVEVKSFFDTNIYYYKYINPFIRSYNHVDFEYYSEGSHNPFHEKTKYINILEETWINEFYLIY